MECGGGLWWRVVVECDGGMWWNVVEVGGWGGVSGEMRFVQLCSAVVKWFV